MFCESPSPMFELQLTRTNFTSIERKLLHNYDFFSGDQSGTNANLEIFLCKFRQYLEFRLFSWNFWLIRVRVFLMGFVQTFICFVKFFVKSYFPTKQKINKICFKMLPHLNPKQIFTQTQDIINYHFNLRIASHCYYSFQLDLMSYFLFDD